MNPGDAINLVPQARALNREKNSDWVKMETSWREAINDGSTLNVSFELKYLDPQYPSRPTEFVVEYEIDGKYFKKTFNNE